MGCFELGSSVGDAADPPIDIAEKATQIGRVRIILDGLKKYVLSIGILICVESQMCLPDKRTDDAAPNVWELTGECFADALNASI